MLTPKLRILQRTVKRLMRRGAGGSLERVMAKTHAADLAFLLEDLSTAERVELIERCEDDEKRADVIADAETEIAAELLAGLTRDRAVALLEHIEPDDVSDILDEMDDEVADDLLKRMRGADREEVEELSRYEATTAGGIMSPRFFALGRDTTAKEAIEELQKVDTSLEMVFYVYVVNEVTQLVGILSLRQLVTTKPETTLFELMTSDVISVKPDVDQEEVAKLASRYGLLAIPVVDEANKLLGIVTVDDVIDVLREEAQEDILRMAGAGDELHGNVLQSALTRFPWLLATGIGGAVSALMLGIYVASLTQFLPLIFFIPLVLGMAGVTGMQSATVVAQSMAQGRSGPMLILRQTAVGLLMGMACGALVIGSGWLKVWWSPVGATSTTQASLIIGCGIAAATVAAAMLGSILPLLFARLRLDPAIASGPFVAIAADVAGLLLYLAIGTAFL